MVDTLRGRLQQEQDNDDERGTRTAGTPSLRARTRPTPDRSTDATTRTGASRPGTINNPTLNTEQRQGASPFRAAKASELASGFNAPSLSEFQKGLENGLQNLRASAPAVASMVAGTLGAEETSERLAQRSADVLSERQFELEVPTVDKISSVEDFAKWGAGVIGSQVPVLAATIGSAVVTRNASLLTPRAAGLRRARRAALNRVRNETTEQGVESARRAAEAITKSMNLRDQFASSVGVVGSIIGVSAPGQAELILNEEARGSVQQRAAAGLATSTAAGLVGILPVNRFLQQTGLARTTQRAVTNAYNESMRKVAGAATGRELPQRGFARALARETVGQGVYEAGSEVAQEVALRSSHAIFKDNVSMFDDEAVANYVEALAASFLVGGAMGSLGQFTSAAAVKLADAADGGGSLASGVMDKLAEVEQERLTTNMFQRGRFRKTAVGRRLREIQANAEQEGYGRATVRAVAEVLGAETAPVVVQRSQDEGIPLDEVIAQDLERNRSQSPFAAAVAEAQASRDPDARFDDGININIGRNIMQMNPFRSEMQRRRQRVQNLEQRLNDRELTEARREELLGQIEQATAETDGLMQAQQRYAQMDEAARMDFDRRLGELALLVADPEGSGLEDMTDADIGELGRNAQIELENMLGSREAAEAAISLAVRKNMVLREAVEAAEGDMYSINPIERAREAGTLSREELEERGEVDKATRMDREFEQRQAGINERQRRVSSIFGQPINTKTLRDGKTVEVPGRGILAPIDATQLDGSRKKDPTKFLREQVKKNFGIDTTERGYGDILSETVEDSDQLVQIANEIIVRSRAQLKERRERLKAEGKRATPPAWLVAPSGKRIRRAQFRNADSAKEFLNNFAVAVPTEEAMEQDIANVEAGGLSLGELSQMIRNPNVSGLPSAQAIALIREDTGARVFVDLPAANRLWRNRNRGAPSSISELDYAAGAVAQLLEQGYRFPTPQETEQALRRARNIAANGRTVEMKKAAQQQLDAFEARNIQSEADIPQDAIVDRRAAGRTITARESRKARERSPGFKGRTPRAASFVAEQSDTPLQTKIDEAQRKLDEAERELSTLSGNPDRADELRGEIFALETEIEFLEADIAQYDPTDVSRNEMEREEVNEEFADTQDKWAKLQINAGPMLERRLPFFDLIAYMASRAMQTTRGRINPQRALNIIHAEANQILYNKPGMMTDMINRAAAEVAKDPNRTPKQLAEKISNDAPWVARLLAMTAIQQYEAGRRKQGLVADITRAADTATKILRDREVVGQVVRHESIYEMTGMLEKLDTAKPAVDRFRNIKQLQFNMLSLSDEEMVQEDHPAMPRLIDQAVEVVLGEDYVQSDANFLRATYTGRAPVDLFAGLTAFAMADNTNLRIEAAAEQDANGELADLIPTEKLEATRTRLEAIANEGMLKGMPTGQLALVGGEVKRIRPFQIKVVHTREDMRKLGFEEDWITEWFQPVGEGGYNNSEGMVFTRPDGTAIRAKTNPIIVPVYINPATPQARQIHTLYHEVGHVIEAELFSRESPEVQRAVIEEYHEWLADRIGHTDAERRTVQAVINEKYGAENTASMFGETPRPLNVNSERDFGALLMSDSADDVRAALYHAGFREYFADQVARYAKKNQRIQSVTARFFKSVAEFFKRMVNIAARRKPNSFEARTLNAWLDSRLGNVTQSIADITHRQPSPYWKAETMKKGNLRKILEIYAPRSMKERIIAAKAINALDEVSAEDNAGITEAVAVQHSRDVGAMVDPMSGETNYHLRDVINMQLTAQERQTLAQVFNQPRVRDQIMAAFQDNFSWVLEMETQQDALIATGYQMWEAGALDLAPAGAGIFYEMKRGLSHAFLGEILQNERAEEILDAMHEGRMESRRTLWNKEAPPDSNIARSRYGLSHAQLRIVGQVARSIDRAREDRVDIEVNQIIERLAQFERFSGENMDNDMLRMIAEDIKKDTFKQPLVAKAMNSPSWVINAPESAFSTTRVIKQDSITQASQKVRALAHGFGRILSTIFYGQMMLARASGNQGLVDAANLLYRDPMSKRQGQSYDQAKTMNIGRFMNRYTQITSPLTTEQKEELRDSVKAGIPLTKKNTSPEVYEAQQAYIKLMKDMRDHMRAAGLDVGDRATGPAGSDRVYFPWVFNEDAFAQRGKEFKALAKQEKYRKSWAKLIKQKYQKAGREVPNLKENPEVIDQFIDHYINGLAKTDGFADEEVIVDPDKLTQPHVRAMNTRELDFLQRLGDDNDKKKLASFLSDDMNRVIATYINQAMKRSTFEEFFGQGKLDDLKANIIAQGGGEREVKMLQDMVDMQMGTYGLEFGPITKQVLGKVGAAFGKDWSNLDPETWRKFQGWAVTYQNIRLLAYAALTNLGDAAGVAVRSGDLTATLQGFRQGFSAFLSERNDNERTALAEQAEMLGATEQIVVQDVLGQLYGGVHFTGTAAKINDMFFKYNGMMALNRYLRMSALGTAKIYLKKHAQRAADGNKDSLRVLRDIGLEPSDLKVGSDGEIIMLDDATVQRLSGGRLPREIARDAELRQSNDPNLREVLRDQRVKDALFRFVDESVMRPSAMQRPGWGNDPNWGVFFHLKAFIYNFHERHLRRAFGKLDEGDYGPMIWMASFPALMIGVDLFRDVVSYGPGGDPRKENWGLMDYGWEGVHRSGVLGVGNIFADMQKAKQYGNTRIMEMAGPTAGQINQMWDAVAGPRDVSDELIDAAPFQNVWKSLDNWSAMREEAPFSEFPVTDPVRQAAQLRLDEPPFPLL